MSDKQLSRISCDIWPQSTIESLQSELRKRADEEIAKRESEFKEMLDQMERDYSQKEQVCTPCGASLDFPTFLEDFLVCFPCFLEVVVKLDADGHN